MFREDCNLELLGSQSWKTWAPNCATKVLSSGSSFPVEAYSTYFIGLLQN